MTRHCGYPRCRREDIIMTYYGIDICERCNDERFAAMTTHDWKTALGLPSTPPTTPAPKPEDFASEADYWAAALKGTS